jgi:CubicO group peptidase (beta-lactamase class C family)
MNTPDNPATVYPGAKWTTADPEDHGIDRLKLKQAEEIVFAIEKRFGFLVIKDGCIIHERYKRNAAATNTIFSLTKGFGATLIGIAQSKGMLHVDDLVADWLPVHHPDIADGAQIKHLLNMTASRTPVGNWWEYNSNFILNSLTGILWLASGLTPHDFYVKYLKQPVGFEFDWPSNERGWIQIGSQGPLPVIQATHHDIARLGHLWLNRGNWNGQQVMDQAFVDAALTPTYPQANGAYGYLWWLNSDAGTWRTTGGTGGQGNWFPYLPTNIFLALGARGKIMIVMPDHNLVVVTMGDTDQEQSGNFLGRIMHAVDGFLPR